MANPEPITPAVITRQTPVSIGVLLATLGISITLLVGAFAWTRSDASWKTTVDFRLQGLENRIVGSNTKGWHREQMRLWVSRMKELNPNLEIVDVDTIPFPPIGD